MFSNYSNFNWIDYDINFQLKIMGYEKLEIGDYVQSSFQTSGFDKTVFGYILQIDRNDNTCNLEKNDGSTIWVGLEDAHFAKEGDEINAHKYKL